MLLHALASASANPALSKHMSEKSDSNEKKKPFKFDPSEEKDP